jgi:toxin ParE1/3/4
MPERIEKTALATQDIEELAAYYLAEAGISVALRFVDHAEQAFAQIARMPMMGALLGFQHPPHADIRRWHIQSFPRLLTLYRPLPDGVEVIRVLDAGRDINALFDDAGFPSA